MPPITGDIVTKTEFDRNKALAEAIATAFGDMLSQRTDDMPHRFRAPKAFGEYMEDHGVNQSYVQYLQITHNNYPVMLQLTTRPTQKILELVFQSADGMRLFTLEIEYAVPTSREVLLPSWPQIYKTPNHRNTSRKEATKASSFLSESPGLNWRKISPKLGAELILSIRNRNRLRYWEFRAAAKPIGFVKLSKSE